MRLLARACILPPWTPSPDPARICRPTGCAPRRRRTGPRAFREVYDVVLGRILKEHHDGGRGLHMGTNEKIARFIHATAGTGLSVLEIGCGFGLTAQEVGVGQREMVGIDAAPVAVETAGRLAAGRDNIRFAVMDSDPARVPRIPIRRGLQHRPDRAPASGRPDGPPEGDVPRDPTGGRYIVKTPSEADGPHEGDDPGEQGFLHFRSTATAR